MKYVQENKLTDTLERELIRSELANEQVQPQPFAAIREAAEEVLSFFAAVRKNARRYNVEYVNG